MQRDDSRFRRPLTVEGARLKTAMKVGIGGIGGSPYFSPPQRTYPQFGGDRRGFLREGAPPGWQNFAPAQRAVSPARAFPRRSDSDGAYAAQSRPRPTIQVPGRELSGSPEENRSRAQSWHAQDGLSASGPRYEAHREPPDHHQPPEFEPREPRAYLYGRVAMQPRNHRRALSYESRDSSMGDTDSPPDSPSKDPSPQFVYAQRPYARSLTMERSCLPAPHSSTELFARGGAGLQSSKSFVDSSHRRMRAERSAEGVVILSGHPEGQVGRGGRREGGRQVACLGSLFFLCIHVCMAGAVAGLLQRDVGIYFG